MDFEDRAQKMRRHKHKTRELLNSAPDFRLLFGADFDAWRARYWTSPDSLDIGKFVQDWAFELTH